MIKTHGDITPMGDTGFVRDNKEGRGRFDLLPWHAIGDVAKHCEEGARKYGERNIDKGAPQHSLIDSGIRHLTKYIHGETDEPHLRAAAWNILWALEQETTHPELNDLPNRENEDKTHDFDDDDPEQLGLLREIKEKCDLEIDFDVWAKCDNKKLKAETHKYAMKHLRKEDE